MQILSSVGWMIKTLGFVFKSMIRFKICPWLCFPMIKMCIDIALIKNTWICSCKVHIKIALCKRKDRKEFWTCLTWWTKENLLWAIRNASLKINNIQCLIFYIRVWCESMNLVLVQFYNFTEMIIFGFPFKFTVKVLTKKRSVKRSFLKTFYRLQTYLTAYKNYLLKLHLNCFGTFWGIKV